MFIVRVLVWPNCYDSHELQIAAHAGATHALVRSERNKRLVSFCPNLRVRGPSNQEVERTIAGGLGESRHGYSLLCGVAAPVWTTRKVETIKTRTEQPDKRTAIKLANALSGFVLMVLRRQRKLNRRSATVSEVFIQSITDRSAGNPNQTKTAAFIEQIHPEERDDALIRCRRSVSPDHKEDEPRRVRAMGLIATALSAGMPDYRDAG